MPFGAIMMIQCPMISSRTIKQCTCQSCHSAALLGASLVVCSRTISMLPKLTFAGIGSDFLVKVIHASRYWCLSIASLIFLLSQCFALAIENPNYLALVSSSTGLAYGFLFGCFPSIVAEAFGVYGFSTNWGFMTLSPVVSGNIFNVFYGTIFDSHSIVEPDGSTECTEGLACYKVAYYITLTSCIIGLVVSLWTMFYVTRKRKEEDRLRELEEREA